MPSESTRGAPRDILRPRAAPRRALAFQALAISVAAIVGLSSLAPLARAEKRIYLGNDDHTDYFWSGDDVEYRAAFQNMLDYYMNQAEQTASNPWDTRGRFNCDGSLWMWEYERSRPAADFDRLVGHLRDSSISMPLNNAVLCYGGMPAEAVLRSMYYAGRLERRLGLRFPLVAAMENQTLPGGLASLWAGSGAEYSWRGVCACATRVDTGNRPREIYWFQGPDDQRVCMKWNTIRSGYPRVGGYAEARDPFAAVAHLDSDPEFLASWPWDVSAAFGYGSDDLQSTTTAIRDAAVDLRTSGRRVIVSNEIDFFQDFIQHHGHQIPTFSGSFGNEWELYSASMGEVSAEVKRQMEKLRSAEVLATVAALLDSQFLAGREEARDQAFMSAGLYFEHDWTADGPVPASRRAQFQRDQLANLSSYVTQLHEDALGEVAAHVSQPAEVRRYVVFNPLSWSRTQFADLAVVIDGPLHVVDVSTGNEVPSQVLIGSPGVLRVLAADVPSVGYKVFEVRPGAGAVFPDVATVALPSFDNGIYRVTMGAGGTITSIRDHNDGDRELVSGALHNLWSGGGTAVLESNGPVSATLKMVAGGTPSHETRVTLYGGLDRIDVEGTITQNFSSEASYTYGFNLAGATMRHEEVGMVAKVARAAQGGDYADQNARTDWLTMNHFVDLSTALRGVTLSNWDSQYFRAGASTIDLLDATTPTITACVGMQVDGPGLGIQDQGGDSHFTNRYALRTHGAYDQAAAMRMALEHQNPFVAAPVTGSASSPLPEGGWSLLSLPSPDVLLWSLKPAEEGIANGLIARVWNLDEGSRPLSLSLPPLGIDRATKTTHLETDLAPATLMGGHLTGTLARQEMRTYRLHPTYALDETTTGVTPADPSRLSELGARPNPFRGSGTIHFRTLERARVVVEIFDVQGRRVRLLQDGELAAGTHDLVWDGRDDAGRTVVNGVYLARLDLGSWNRTVRFAHML